MNGVFLFDPSPPKNPIKFAIGATFLSLIVIIPLVIFSDSQIDLINRIIYILFGLIAIFLIFMFLGFLWWLTVKIGNWMFK